MPPNNIDEVIARLNDMIDGALREEPRVGYFAALYERVTTNVRRALAAGAAGREHVIAKRDAETAVVGRTLYPLHGFADRVARWIHASECADIRENIQTIAE